MEGVLERIGHILQLRLFTIAGTEVNVATIITFALVLVAAFVVSKAVTRSMRHYFSRSGVTDEGTIAVTTRLVHFIVLAIGFGIAVHMIGINLGALFAAGALFAVGLGFAMQNIAQNFVSGLILMLERTIKPGDVLAVDGEMVRVMDLGHRAIVARTLDDEDLIIPNSVLVQSTVKNYTLRDQLYRVRIDVGVVYGSDMKLVRETLERCAKEFPGRNGEKDPIIFMATFGDSSVGFEVSIWIDNAWNTRAARSKLNEAVWWALKDAGITIAFPQLDVHLDTPVVDSLQRLAPPERR